MSSPLVGLAAFVLPVALVNRAALLFQPVS